MLSISEQLERKTGKELYSYQKGAIQKIFQCFETAADDYHLLYQLPTGGGKTVIFSEIVSQYLKTHKKKVLVMTHRIELCKQTSSVLTEFGVQNKVIDSKANLEDQSKFDCFVIPDYGNILNLINCNTYVVYGIIENNKLISCYFFRNSHMIYDKRNEKEIEENKKIIEKKSIELFASISCCHHNEIFLKGFTMALYKYSKKIKADLITIENISHNNIIIYNLFLLNKLPLLISPTAYFYYNYVKKSCLSEKTFIIC